MSWQLGEIHKHKPLLLPSLNRGPEALNRSGQTGVRLHLAVRAALLLLNFFLVMSTTDYQVALLIPLLVHTDCDGKGPHSSLECKAFVLSVSYQRPLRILQMRVLSVRYLHFIELNTTMKLYPHQT